jgi:hypothetical protein
MFRKKNLILVSLLLLTTLACSLTSVAQDEVKDIAATQIADVVSPENEDTPPDAPQASSATENSGDFLSPQQAKDIHSFRTRMSYGTVSTADGTPMETMITEGEYINGQPPSEHIVINLDMHDEHGAETIEYIRVGTQIWMHYADQWMSINDESVDFLSDMLPDGSDTIASDWDKLGKEDVNGIQTTHYRITDPSSLQGWFENPEAGTIEENAFTAEQLDLYVNDDNVIIKQEYRAEGKIQTEDGSTQDVKMTFSIEVYDINANDIVIEPPNNEELGAGAQLPVPENATATLNSAAFSVYNVPDGTLDGVVAFYDGSGEVSVSSKMGTAEEGYILMVQYEGKDYTLTISPAENSGVDISILSMSE